MAEAGRCHCFKSKNAKVKTRMKTKMKTKMIMKNKNKNTTLVKKDNKMNIQHLIHTIYHTLCIANASKNT